MTEFIYRGDQNQYEQARLDTIIKDTLHLCGTGRQGVRMAVRRLIKLGYDNDTGQTRLALHLSQLQHRAGTDGKRRASDLSRVRVAFEAERKRKRARTTSPTTPRR